MLFSVCGFNRLLYGPKYQERRLEDEGHAMVQKGKRFRVENYEQSLMDLSGIG
jgi:hypothetical protein